MDCTVAGRLRASPERVLEKGSESLVAHLARGHRELAMAAPGISVTADPHIVRWVQKCRGDLCLLTDHRGQEGPIPRIPTPDPVLAQDPDVAKPGPRRCRRCRKLIVIGV